MGNRRLFQWVFSLLLVVFMGSASAAEKVRERTGTDGQRSSLLGSPEGWVMGPATGFPTLFGWRLERSLGDGNEAMPSWLAAADLGIALPGARITVEKRIGKGPFYTGLGGRVLYFPDVGGENDFGFYTLSVPLSYRTGKGTDRRSLHLSLSAEFTTHTFDTWRLYPALQISFLSGL